MFELGFASLTTISSALANQQSEKKRHREADKYRQTERQISRQMRKQDREKMSGESEEQARIATQ